MPTYHFQFLGASREVTKNKCFWESLQNATNLIIDGQTSSQESFWTVAGGLEPEGAIIRSNDCGCQSQRRTLRSQGLAARL